MKRSEKYLHLLIFSTLLAGCCVEFFDIAWGTGEWLGQLAFTWALLLLLFTIVCLTLLIVLSRFILLDAVRTRAADRLIAYRLKLNKARWILVAVFLFLPVGLFQYTVLGIVFQGIWLRVSVWAISLFFLGVLLTKDEETVVNWKVFLFSLLLMACSFSIFASLRFVTSYPFSLGWSEGNRLWDYSILFGRERYDYPETEPIPVFLDLGRQLVGGLPFLIPGLSIKMERLWVGLVSILPHFVLGLIAFRSFSREKYLWFSFSMWAYLFLLQGPIHIPLIVCAILVVAAWRSNPWYSISLVLIASAFAYKSRFTWTFAPLIWFMILEYLDASAGGEYNFHLTPRIKKLALMFIGCTLGGFIVYFLIMKIRSAGDWNAWNFFLSLPLAPAFVQKTLAEQPLLWYRLLPNETYTTGVLIGLFMATAPLVVLLIYLLHYKIFKISNMQAWMATVPLLAFLGVGLVVSSKIGGGGDLHNLDMYLIGLLFTGIVAVHKGALEWLQNSQSEREWVKIMIVMLIAVPAIRPLQEMQSYQYGHAASWLVALTDAPNERALDMYPLQEEVNKSIGVLQHEADLARATGEVLFMDQRQLLTFGYIQDVALVPEYDKKVLMENALANKAAYFKDFYDDLAHKRFSLIITQPLVVSKKGSADQFGEENDAWVGWVTRPLLCYYDIKETLISVNVQLLVPRIEPVDCAESLPWQGE